ncbi:MAG: response regulator, partial [Pseudohongiella sp.]|nr:response regulator [Pseudohongiella sp.]
HELRTPLNSILGFSEMLSSDTDLKPEQLARLGVITTSGQHLLRLIDDLLDIAGLQSEKLQVTNKNIAIAALFEDCRNLIAPIAETHQVTVEFAQIQPDLPAINADATRLRQVLLNLLSNAIKYNRKHGWVNVTVKPAEELAHGLRIEVKDTGAGLSEQECSRIFMPFERLGRHASTIDGTGIGLSISKELIELMHGRIGVNSMPGHGACFWIELPTAMPDEKTLPTYDSDLEHLKLGGDIDNKSLKILVVEDNPFNQKLIQAQLAALGFSCMLAADGLEALEMYQQAEFDLIVTDIMMPNMDGLELTRRMRALEAGSTRYTRIIACSANAMESDQFAALLVGTDDYIVKPVSKAALERAILNTTHLRKNS